ncbi:MAG: hypothetical protein EBR30_03025 [Cytophagia bacterium]|nr:hypothetical protein [Cytophagia bacterium]NBW34008.1 hypothetical protein [Cytophagia bacterium]
MPKTKLALFNHHPECSIDCCNGMIEALSPEYRVDLFTKEQFNRVILKDYAAVMFPGGIGDSHTHYNFFTRRQGNMLAEYVETGGKYIGICMGAYWAGPWYFDLLEGIDVVQYIKRPGTEIKRSYGTTANITWCDNEYSLKNYDMFFYDGCTFIGDENTFETVARYANGDPMAIVQGNIGLIGCHPESEQHWYDKRYLKKHWHHREHHKLLKQFVNDLL